jgi:cytochrome c553
MRRKREEDAAMKLHILTLLALVCSATSSVLRLDARTERIDEGQLVSSPARVAEMHQRYRAVSIVQAALVRGDVTAVNPSARTLSQSEVPPGLPESASKHAMAMRDAARDASVATNVAAAAAATATMLATCGSCHRSVGTMPAPSSVNLPAVGGTVGHMLDHQRAIDRMLRGLVVPSESEWMNGARGLRAAPLHARELPRDAKLTPALLRVEEAVHRLAEEAVGADTVAAKVRVYGTLLARCAECHGLHKGVWGPPPAAQPN